MTVFIFTECIIPLLFLTTHYFIFVKLRCSDESGLRSCLLWLILFPLCFVRLHQPLVHGHVCKVAFVMELRSGAIVVEVLELIFTSFVFMYLLCFGESFWRHLLIHEWIYESSFRAWILRTCISQIDSLLHRAHVFDHVLFREITAIASKSLLVWRVVYRLRWVIMRLERTCTEHY